MSPFLTLRITKGNTKGAHIRPSKTPMIAVTIPKSKPSAQNKSFIPISQINPSKSKVKINPGKLIDFENQSKTTSCTTQSKNRQDTKENTMYVRTMVTIRDENSKLPIIPEIKRTAKSTATIEATERLHVS